MARSSSTPTSPTLGSRKEDALRSLAEAGSGFEEGRRRTPVDIVGGSPRRVRESLTSYLFPFSPNASTTSPQPVSGYNTNNIAPFTPPSSLTPNVVIYNQFNLQPPHSPLLTPESSNESCSPSSANMSTTPMYNANNASIPLIATLFPFHSTQLSTMSTVLEIVTPPDHVLAGFIADHPAGRTVYVHLPPPHVSSHRPEALSGNFSDVLRPHDPSRSPHRQFSSPLDGLDIRESLTALLDLSADQLDAKALVLVLDKDDRELEGLNELLHSLMYVGGHVLPPGKKALDGGWEWDPRRWVLVGMEL